LVLVIDDDPALCEALRDLLESGDLRVETFRSAGDMLGSPLLRLANCLVLDIRLPAMSGLEVQQELSRSGVEIPVIFMTGHADIPMAVKAMKAGAVDFLSKPFRDQDMFDAVLSAIARDRDRRRSAEVSAELHERFMTLSDREREVMAMVTQGLMNKQIAGRLGVSEITVKIHRKHAMIKMGARTLPDLVRLAAALGLQRARDPAESRGQARRDDALA
jgi:FixJ family two-component response regulator